MKFDWSRTSFLTALCGAALVFVLFARLTTLSDPAPAPVPVARSVPPPTWVSPRKSCREVVVNVLYACPDGHSWQDIGGGWGEDTGPKVPSAQ